jgi:hypothetical protein
MRSWRRMFNESKTICTLPPSTTLCAWSNHEGAAPACKAPIHHHVVPSLSSTTSSDLVENEEGDTDKYRLSKISSDV